MDLRHKRLDAKLHSKLSAVKLKITFQEFHLKLGQRQQWHASLQIMIKMVLNSIMKF